MYSKLKRRSGACQFPNNSTAKSKAMVISVLRLIGLCLLFFFCPQGVASTVDGAPQGGLKPAPYSGIVRLNIPLRRNDGAKTYHVTEDCSGTLVDRDKGIIVTAWHCFDGKMDLTQPPKAWFNGGWQELRLGAHGGGIKDDWAITYLSDPNVIDAPAIPYALTDLVIGSIVTMAGYQRVGQRPDALWSLVQTTCAITKAGDYWVETDCHLETGASGGAVMQIKGGHTTLAGIISARSAQGGVWFVPMSRLNFYFSPP
jgi:hypothetical protein